MYDVVQLEAQWRRYKVKQYLILAVIILVFLLIAAALFFWLRGSNTAPSEDDAIREVQIKTEPKSGNISSPSLPLATETPSKLQVSKPKDSRKTRGWNMTFADDKSPNNSSKNSVALPPSKHVDIEVTTRKSAFSAQEIAKRYRFAKNKDDALFLARFYYEKKQYKDALKWALETNKLDSDIEESWLIFGRAKALLGQRMEAIRVLQAYYDRTGSKKAKALLGRIRRGKKF